MAMGISAAEMRAHAWRQMLQTALEPQTWLPTAPEPGGEHPCAGQDGTPILTSSPRAAAGGNVPAERVLGGDAASTWPGGFAPGAVPCPRCHSPLHERDRPEPPAAALGCGHLGWKAALPITRLCTSTCKGWKKHLTTSPGAEIPAHPAGQRGGGMLSCWLSAGTPGAGGKDRAGPGAAPGESPQGCAIISDPSKTRRGEIRQLLALMKQAAAGHQRSRGVAPRWG